MEYFASEALINARAPTVWDVITDTGNFTVWESGITESTVNCAMAVPSESKPPTAAGEGSGSASSKYPEKP